MSDQIETHKVKQFARGISHLAQQKFSRFRAAVQMVPFEAGEETFLDFLGTTTPQKRTGRHTDTQYTETPHSRRKIFTEPYTLADLIDKPDILRTIHEMTNPYQVSFGRGFARTIDDIAIASAFATAYTGKGGTTTVAFNAAGGWSIPSSDQPLTMLKLLIANEKLRAAENDPDEGLFIAVSQRQARDMLSDSQFTSADYNTIRSLMTGEINQFLGFTWIMTERLEFNSSSERRCIAWGKNSIGLMIAAEPRSRITEMPTKHYSTQVYMDMDAGGARLNETGVLEVLCKEP